MNWLSIGVWLVGELIVVAILLIVVAILLIVVITQKRIFKRHHLWFNIRVEASRIVSQARSIRKFNWGFCCQAFLTPKEIEMAWLILLVESKEPNFERRSLWTVLSLSGVPH